MPAPPITLLGRILNAGENIQRDTVHIAIAPVTADEYLIPGQHVGKRENGRYGMVEEPIGVVDPFLDCHVQAGEMFYVCLYPNTVTSLLHVWTHPAFEEAPEATISAVQVIADGVARREARQRIEDWCNREYLDFDNLMSDIEDYVNDGGYPCRDDDYEGVILPSTFWADYSILTGRQIREDQVDDFYFSCSC